MRSDWEWRTVADLQAAGVILVEDGNHGEYRPRPDEFTEDGTRFIRAADMSDGRVLFERASSITDKAMKRIRKGVGQPGDVLFSHKGTVGKVALVPPDAPAFVCSPQTTFWRTVDPAVLDRSFLHVYMRSPDFTRQWYIRKGETDMADYVSLTAQRSLLVPLPDIDAQRRLAALVGAYDELIENNLRRIELLEEMAQAIYREWFVNFRYPGHEADELVDSAVGPIPEGWEVVAFGDLATEVKEGVNPDNVEPDTPYLGLEHIPRRSFTLTEFGSVDSVASRKWRFLPGDILFGKLRPYFHKVVEAPVAGVCSTDAIVMRPREERRDLALMVAFSAEFVAHAVGTAGGTDRPRAKWSDLEKFPVALPPHGLIARFSEVVRPMVDLAANLARQNANLRATRDLLLPKLVSGEIDVSGLDIDTSWLAA